jgi:hypothetical protein
MKKIIFLLMIVLLSLRVVAQETKNEIVLGLRVNPSITWNQNAAPEAGFSLNIENGYTLNHTYLSIGYSPVNNVIYTFNEHWLTSFPIAVVGVLGNDFKNNEAFWQAGIDVGLNQEKAMATLLIGSNFSKYEPSFQLSFTIPFDLSLKKW